MNSGMNSYRTVSITWQIVHTYLHVIPNIHCNWLPRNGFHLIHWKKKRWSNINDLLVQVMFVTTPALYNHAYRSTVALWFCRAFEVMVIWLLCHTRLSLAQHHSNFVDCILEPNVKSIELGKKYACVICTPHIFYTLRISLTHSEGSEGDCHVLPGMYWYTLGRVEQRWLSNDPWYRRWCPGRCTGKRNVVPTRDTKPSPRQHHGKTNSINIAAI